MADLLGFNELWTKLCEGDESFAIEAKRGSDVGKSIWETISAFSNEPDAGGGYIVAGVCRKDKSLFPDYEVVGIKTPDKIQSDLATQCREVFNVPVRPDMRVEQARGKLVLIAHIPEAQPQHKPVYIKSRGIPNGAFRRIGPTDQVCTDDDLALFYQAQGTQQYDETVIEDTSLADVDRQSIELYRKYRSSLIGGSSELLEYNDEDLLYAVGATARKGDSIHLTLSGLALFGTSLALRRHMPMMRVDYIRVPGKEWVANPEHRYHTIEKLGSLIRIIPSIIELILDDLPKAFSLPADQLQRQDLPLIPKNVIREAIVNSVMHRSYRQNSPVQIIRYSNRLEIKNPGYSLVPEERLGEPGSKTRNPRIAAALHDIGFAETKGTGVRVMRQAMELANLTIPLFESDRIRDEFAVRLLVHHLLSEEDVTWLGGFKDCNLSADEARAILVVREIGAINNSIYRGLNHVDTLSASNHLRRMRDVGLLEQKGRGAGTYYVSGPKITGSEGAAKLRAQGSLRTELGELRPELSDKLDLPQKVAIKQLRLPQQIVAKIIDLPLRATTGVLDELILDLCRFQPMSLIELSTLTRKHHDHLRQRNIQRLIACGYLEFLHPGKPKHPDQKYVTIDRMESRPLADDQPLIPTAGPLFDNTGGSGN